MSNRSSHSHNREMARKAQTQLKRAARLERRKARRARRKGEAVEVAAGAHVEAVAP